MKLKRSETPRSKHALCVLKHGLRESTHSDAVRGLLSGTGDACISGAGQVLPKQALSKSLYQLGPPATTISTADIWLVVSVPVLSEQMTVVHPSVSTLGSFRTIALRFAIFL